MSWAEVDKKEFIKAVDVLSLVPQRAGTPSSDFVRVVAKNKKLEMALSSTVTGIVQVSLTQPIPFTEPFFIDKGLFESYVQAGKSWKGNFRMTAVKGKWLLRQGSRKAEFFMRAEPVSGYGVWRETNKSSEIVFSDDLRKLLIASNNCSTADPSVPHLNCVYIGGKLVISTNVISLFVGVRPVADSLRIPFPVGLIPLLGDNLVRAVAVENNRVILNCGCGFIEGTVSAVAQKSFPKKSVVEKIQKGRGWPLLAKLPADKLAKMLTRLSSYLSNVKREDWIVELLIANGVVNAAVKIQQGKFEEQMEFADVKSEGLLRWPLELAQAVVEYMASNGELIKIRVDDSKNTPYLLSGGGVEMMVARQVGK